MNSIIQLLLGLKKAVGAEYIIEQYLQPAGEYAMWLLALIVFAETGLMIGFFLPGDSLLFLAGLGVAAGWIPQHIGVVMAVLVIAAIAGDQTGYLIGKSVGPKLFTKEESLFFKPKYVEKTREFYDRHGGKTIIIGRFVPFVRTFAPMIAGVAGLEYRTFVSYNVIGGFLWIVSMLGAGFALGEFAKPYISYITVGIILVSLVPIFTTFWQERQNAKKAAAQKKTEAQ